MTGQGARRRIERLLVIAASQTLTQAAGTLRTTQSTLSSQLKTLEDACGGQLIERHPGTRGIGNLTPLGEQLCEQARSHLEPAVSSPNP
jgi:DNA-binding transcriptional LysR family regulator